MGAEGGENERSAASAPTWRECTPAMAHFTWGIFICPSPAAAPKNCPRTKVIHGRAWQNRQERDGRRACHAHVIPFNSEWRHPIALGLNGVESVAPLIEYAVGPDAGPARKLVRSPRSKSSIFVCIILFTIFT